MPLRDHFHPPLSEERAWSGLHGGWSTILAIELNQQLPVGYHAEPTAHYGIETEVGVLTDTVGVQVFAGAGSRRLVGAIELVSPANKDRVETRTAFVNKYRSILRGGVGLIVVDIVTERHFNLHQALLEEWAGPQDPPFDADLYAVAYRPILGEARPYQLDIWTEPLALRGPLPTLPLWVLGIGPLDIDFNETYELTLSKLRFDAE